MMRGMRGLGAHWRCSLLDGTKILKARKHLMVAFQEALRALEAHLVAFVAGDVLWHRVHVWTLSCG